METTISDLHHMRYITEDLVSTRIKFVLIIHNSQLYPCFLRIKQKNKKTLKSFLVASLKVHKDLSNLEKKYYETTPHLPRPKESEFSKFNNSKSRKYFLIKF